MAQGCASLCCRFICTNIGPWPKRKQKKGIGSSTMYSVHMCRPNYNHITIIVGVWLSSTLVSCKGIVSINKGVTMRAIYRFIWMINNIDLYVKICFGLALFSKTNIKILKKTVLIVKNKKPVRKCNFSESGVFKNFEVLSRGRFWREKWSIVPVLLLKYSLRKIQGGPKKVYDVIQRKSV